MQITVTVTGVDNVKQWLEKLGASFFDFTGALQSLAKQLIVFYSDTVFVSSGQALGSTWARLATKTQEQKSNKWPGRGILVRTGAMQRSFESEVTPDTLLITNRSPYFPYHQLGTSTGPGRGHNIPARPMLGVNTRVESMIKAVIKADIAAKIAASEA